MDEVRGTVGFTDILSIFKWSKRSSLTDHVQLKIKTKIIKSTNFSFIYFQDVLWLVNGDHSDRDVQCLVMKSVCVRWLFSH